MSELFQRINWVDVFVVILLIRSSYVGAATGLSTELFKSIGIILGLYLATRFYSDLGAAVTSKIALPPELADGLSFLILIFVSAISLKLLGIALAKVVKLTFADKVNKWGGFVLGLLRGIIILSLIFIFFGILQIDYFVKSVEERSLTGPHIKKVAPLIYRAIAKTASQEFEVEGSQKAGEKK